MITTSQTEGKLEYFGAKLEVAGKILKVTESKNHEYPDATSDFFILVRSLTGKLQLHLVRTDDTVLLLEEDEGKNRHLWFDDYSFQASYSAYVWIKEQTTDEAGLDSLEKVKYLACSTQDGFHQRVNFFRMPDEHNFNCYHHCRVK